MTNKRAKNFDLLFLTFNISYIETIPKKMKKGENQSLDNVIYHINSTYNIPEQVLLAKFFIKRLR